jgi:GcrA cell cycle regulator
MAARLTHPPTTWTDERIAELTRLWADGNSASHIAKHFGDCTRNAVIGKVHRLGLPGRLMTGGQTANLITRMRLAHQERKAKAPKAPKAPPVKRERYGGARAVPKPPRLVIAGNNAVVVVPEAPEPWIVTSPSVPLPNTTPKPWMEREFGECTWPVGGEGADTLSCCAPIHKQSWCKAHFKLGVLPVQPAKIRIDRRWAA